MNNDDRGEQNLTMDIDNEPVEFCKRCGRRVTNDPITVTEDTLHEYMRCRLGGIPYSKEFKLLDGSFVVTLETADGNVARSLERYLDSNGVLVEPDAQILALLVSVARVDKTNATTTTVYEASSDVRRKYLDNVADSMSTLCKDIDTIELGLIRRCVKTFVILNNVLIESILDENFYKGVGLR